MPYDSSGIYSLPSGYLAVEGQTILPSQHNPPLQDIANGLSQVLLRSGVAPMTGPLNMNGFRVTGIPAGSDPDDLVIYSQLSAVVTQLSQAVPTGTVLMMRRKTAPTGWIAEGGTIGNISSGATYANAAAFNLFSLMWSEFTNTELPIQDSGGAASTRGASAQADWNANKRMPLFDPRSRFPRAADNGLAYDTGLTVGAAQADDFKSHTHGVTDPGHSHTISFIQGVTAGGTAERVQSPPQAGSYSTSSAFTGISLQDTGGTETRPRSSVYLFCIKL